MAGQAADGRLGRGQVRQAQRPAGPGGHQAHGRRRQHAVGGSGQEWEGCLEQQVAGRGSSLGGASEFGTERAQGSCQFRFGARRVGGAELVGDGRGVGDVGVAFGGVQRAAGAVALIRGKEAVDINALVSQYRQ